MRFGQTEGRAATGLLHMNVVSCLAGRACNEDKEASSFSFYMLMRLLLFLTSVDEKKGLPGPVTTIYLCSFRNCQPVVEAEC